MDCERTFSRVFKIWSVRGHLGQIPEPEYAIGALALHSLRTWTFNVSTWRTMNLTGKLLADHWDVEYTHFLPLA